MAQVRLDRDVESALRAVVASDGGSVAQHANRVLRAALDLTAADPGRSGPASVSAPSLTGQNRCQHPVTRRIGNRCGACGAELARGRR